MALLGGLKLWMWPEGHQGLRRQEFTDQWPEQNPKETHTYNSAFIFYYLFYLAARSGLELYSPGRQQTILMTLSSSVLGLQATGLIATLLLHVGGHSGPHTDDNVEVLCSRRKGVCGAMVPPA